MPNDTAPIDDAAFEDPGSVVSRRTMEYPEYFLIYREYWSYLDALTSNVLRGFIEEMQQDFTDIVHDSSIDEFNMSNATVKIAADYRVVGHLKGTVALLDTAEKIALFCRYSTPIIWCEIARVYTSIPLAKEAKRCVDTATDSLARADTDMNAILPGDTSGRWIPEFDMDHYKTRIVEISDTLRTLPPNPFFRPSETMQLLNIEDGDTKEAFQDDILRWCNGFTSPDRVSPRLK